MLIQMVLSHQGVALGWHHLVGHLLEQGLLVRPVSEEVVHRESLHYLTFSEDKEADEACCRLRDWLMQQF
ncbi:DNA-binding transcriptional activator GcvA [compost metagenome]